MPHAFQSVFPLRAGRVHEVFGPAATGFAAAACARAEGNLVWIRERWRPEELCPLGLSSFFDPARLLVAQAPNQADALAVTEEALREGAVALVVVETSRALDLREGRRLQLAAGAGGTTGLCIIPEGMGSNAAHTRWHAVPLLGPGDPERADSTLMRWKIIKNKSGTFGAWDVRWNTASRRLHVVSPVGERPVSQGPAD